MARHMLHAGCTLLACEAVQAIFRRDGLSHARGLSAFWHNGWPRRKEPTLVWAQALLQSEREIQLASIRPNRQGVQRPASVRQRASVAAALSPGWKGKVSHCVRSASRHSTSREPGSRLAELVLEEPWAAFVLLAGGVESTTSASPSSWRGASSA